MIDDVQATKLPNGIAVLTEHMPGLRSVTAGIWVRRGSRHESAELNGICHFIEHAVFKGTQHRSARDIAIETDRLGGNLDAYTTHEMTGFTTKVADTALPQAIDLLADLVSHPRFEQEDLEREQKVILEEMKMVEDTPDELLGELFNAAYFPNQPLGRPIEGTRETVPTFDHKTTVGYHAREFNYNNLVVAAAGNVHHARLVELVGAAFDGCESGAGVRPQGLEPGKPRPAAPILIEQKSELEQAHLVVATPWPHATSPDRYAASLLASVIGGGTSSRLWQEIREERGLAYSVGAAGSAFSDIGVFNIYAGTSPEYLDEVLELSLNELREVVRNCVTEEELRIAKDQAISSILLGLESSSARAGTLARQEIIHGRRISPDEVIEKIRKTTVEELQEVARTYFQTETVALGVLGNLNGFHADRSRLEI
ncbi:MAG TPA: pitrilysin family protein [Pyrinomonadaceae bacterium]|nr:pitrilysin family protein [Pyrinomonadaceae bacterium]